MYAVALLDLFVSLGWTFGVALVLAAGLLPQSVIPRGWFWRGILGSYRRRVLYLGTTLFLVATVVFGALSLRLVP